jgi:hypothetical protein
MMPKNRGNVLPRYDLWIAVTPTLSISHQGGREFLTFYETIKF